MQGPRFIDFSSVEPESKSKLRRLLQDLIPYFGYPAVKIFKCQEFYLLTLYPLAVVDWGQINRDILDPQHRRSEFIAVERIRAGFEGNDSFGVIKIDTQKI